MGSVKNAYLRYLDSDAGARKYLEFRSLLYGQPDSLVTRLLESIRIDWGHYSTERVCLCDIGGGDGQRIGRILRCWHSAHGMAFDLDFIEQSRPYVEIVRKKQFGDFCAARVHHALFEDVELEAGRYDLVCLIHSIFAFSNGRNLRRVLSLVVPCGAVLLVSNAPNSFLGGLKAIVDEGYEDKRYEIDACEQDLAKSGLEFERTSFETRWAVDDSECDSALRVILEWISLGTVEMFSPRKRDAVQDYILANSVREGSRRLFREEERCLLISGSGERLKSFDTTGGQGRRSFSIRLNKTCR